MNCLKSEYNLLLIASIRSGYHGNVMVVQRTKRIIPPLESLVHGALLDEVAGLKLLLTTTSDLLVLGHGSTVAGEAINGGVDVATNGLANALDFVRTLISRKDYSHCERTWPLANMPFKPSPAFAP